MMFPYFLIYLFAGVGHGNGNKVETLEIDKGLWFLEKDNKQKHNSGNLLPPITHYCHVIYCHLLSSLK